MKQNYPLTAALNFGAVLILMTILTAPFYFATSFTKPANIAGAKTQNPYIIISNVANFPQMQLTQTGSLYTITFVKVAQSQVFTGVLTITNPTKSATTYELVSTGDGMFFFGEDPGNQLTRITLPTGASVPISLFSNTKTYNSPQEASLSVEI